MSQLTWKLLKQRPRPALYASSRLAAVHVSHWRPTLDRTCNGPSVFDGFDRRRLQ